MMVMAASLWSLIHLRVSNHVLTSACTASGCALMSAGRTTRWVGMAPGNSADVLIAWLPVRWSAFVVNGADTQTASSRPVAKAAAAAFPTGGGEAAGGPADPSSTRRNTTHL